MKHQFSERLLELRNKRGLTQEAFGARVGLTKSKVSNIETRYRNKTGTTFDTLLNIASTFGVSTDWLLGHKPIHGNTQNGPTDGS